MADETLEPQLAPEGEKASESTQGALQWDEQGPMLHPMISWPLDKITVCNLSRQCYIIGSYTNRCEQKAKPVLTFNKTNSDVLVYDIHTRYTAEQVKVITNHALKEQAVLRAKALLGCVRFTRGHYLLIAKRRRLVGRIGFHRIFEALDLELLPLSLSGGEVSVVSWISAVRGASSDQLQEGREEEEYYCSRFISSWQKQAFFYSPTYDLTNTLQTNMFNSGGRCPIRSKFVWNEFFMEPFFTQHQLFCLQGARQSAAGDLRIPICPDGLEQWIVPIVQGSIVQRTVWCGSRPILITVIARTSKNYAGVRYFRRGVSSDGHVANHVEVEQIVSDESTLHTNGMRGNFTSYVQVRGSVPLNWFQPPTQLPKPPIKLGTNDPHYSHARKHFQELVLDYGRPIIVMNLLRQQEKRVRESTLSNEYKKVVKMLARYAKNAASDESGEQSEVLIYREFDIRKEAHCAWNSATALAEEALERTGFFFCDGRVACGRVGRLAKVQLQKGVVRSNCLDCIDRTNIAQYFFGLHVLGHQLQALGLLHSHVDIALSPQVQELLLQIYLHVGDAIAMHYGGSPQVGAGVVNRGTGWDKMMGIKRLYNNILGDREKQMMLNLFLGRYQPCPKWYSVANNPAMSIPHDSHSDAGRRSMDGQLAVSKRVGFATELSENYSDYYLQVKSAPSFLNPAELNDWWKEPLRCFHAMRRQSAAATSLVRNAVVGDRSNVEGEEEEDTVHDLCRCELAAALGFERGETNDLVGSGGVDGEDEVPQNKGCTLRPTSVSTTLSARTAELYTLLQQHRHAQSVMMFARDFIRQQRRQDLEHQEYNMRTGSGQEVPTDLLVHDHTTYPKTLRASEVYKDVELMRGMSDDCEPAADLHRMQLVLLGKYGDVDSWDVESVVGALMDVEPSVSHETIQYIRQLGCDGRMLLHHLDTESMQQSALLERFIALICRMTSGSATAHAHHPELSAFTNSLADRSDSAAHEGLPGPFCLGAIPFPDTTCRLLQPYFVKVLLPSNLESTVRHLLKQMGDATSGLPRKDRLRYHEGANSRRVPPVIVAPQCFSAHELHQWLLKESARLGLTLHEHVEKQDAAQACWQFVLWLAHANLIIPVVIEPVSGVVVQASITHYSAAMRNKLFVLCTLQEVCVLNAEDKHLPVSSDQTGTLKRVSVTKSEALTGHTALGYAESLANLALKALTSLRMPDSSAFPLPDGSQEFVSPALMDVIFSSSTHLAKVDTTMLQQEELFCFWVNVFNALYVHAWLTAIRKKAQEFTCFYSRNVYNIGGQLFSLSDIKNGILRGNRPPYYALLPPFEEGDPRSLMTCCVEHHGAALDGDGTGGGKCDDDHLLLWKVHRVLLVLIDTYLLPGNFEYMPSYNPRSLFYSSTAAVPQSSGSVGNMSMGSANDDLDPTASSIIVSGTSLLRQASSIPAGAAMWFSSFLGQWQSKSVPLAHPCTPLRPESLAEQMETAENFMARSLCHTQQLMVVRNKVHVPRVLLPVFVHCEELGVDWLLRYLFSGRSDISESQPRAQ
ncbi:SacI like domain [Trypanosoma vivax]|nr:SacI like domain [Trypanosoma vivax]